MTYIVTNISVTYRIYICIYIYIYPKCFPFRISRSISNSDIPEYIQITYPDRYPKKIILDFFGYPFISIQFIPETYPYVFATMISMHVSVKDIHVKYPNYILFAILLYPTLFIGPAGVLHNEIILTVTRGFSMRRSAAPVPSRMLEPLRELRLLPM